MKTPLRTCWQWQGGEPCLNKHDEPRCTIMEQVTRWKRKNRIRQLKHTIAKQAKEIYHLRKLVELKLATEYAESEKQALRWAQENIVIRTFAPNLACEEIDGKLMLCNVAPRPQITFK